MSKFASFAKGWALGDKIGADVDKFALDKEMKDIAGAEVKTTGGNVNGTDGDLVDSGNAATVEEAQGLSKATTPLQYGLLGKNQDTPFTQDQITSIRNAGLAAAMKKYDPVKGMQMEQSNQQAQREQERGQRESTKFGWESTDRARLDQKQSAIESANKQAADYISSLTNPDGTPRQATVDDVLTAQTKKAYALASAGQIDEAMNAQHLVNAATAEKIRSETEQRNAALGKAVVAAQSGDLATLKDFYNKWIPDGGTVTGFTQAKDGSLTVQRTGANGEVLPPTTFKDMGQLTSTLQSFTDPSKLYQYTINERNYQLQKQHQDTMAAQAAATIGLHNAQLEEMRSKTADRKDLSAIHTSLNDAIDSGDKAAEDTARKKLSAYVKSGKGEGLTKEERLANAYLASGKASTFADALDLATRKVQTSPKDDYMALSKAGMSPAEIGATMEMFHGSEWKAKMQGGLSSGLAKLPAGVPQGSKQIGTSGGKPVYQTPDGKKLIVD